MPHVIFILFFLVSLSVGRTCTAGEIMFWHSFKDIHEQRLQQAMNQFERTNPEIKVQLVYKGCYTEAFDTFAQSVAGPHILQVAEYQFETLRKQTDKYRAVDELISVHAKDFPLYVSGFYARDNGRIPALPFNISSGVMFINWDAWQKAGLSEWDVPKTWAAFEETLKNLQCDQGGGFSTVWPAAYIIEHFAAQCGLPLQDQEGHLDFSHPLLVKRLKNFSRLAAENYYTYGGRYSDAESLFTESKVTVFFQGANRYHTLAEKANFTIRAFPIPFDHTCVDKPYALNIGGASLWATSGHAEAVYEDIKTLFTFLLKAETQASWFEHTSYLPITNAGLQKVLSIAHTDGRYS